MNEAPRGPAGGGSERLRDGLRRVWGRAEISIGSLGTQEGAGAFGLFSEF